MPKNKRILVLGARGMLGSALVLHLHKLGYDTLALNRSQFDACRDSVTKLELNGLSLVINAIGLINRRLSDKNAVADFCLVNSVFPRVLADHCAVQKVSMIHITTDCVFTGSNGPYNENDTHDADDLYGRSKSLGESQNCLVLRTSIIGPEQTNHYSLLSWFLSQSGQVCGYKNHQWNGVTTLQLADIIGQILSKEMYKWGGLHIFSEDTTKYQLLRMFKQAYQKDIEIVARDDDKARDTRLRSIHLDVLGNLHIPPLEAQIDYMAGLSNADGCWKS